MALFRCNKCGHIREVGNDYIGKSANCPECDQITPIYDTTAFVKALIKKHISLSKEQTQGMTSMYDLTFTNEANFIDHIEKII